MEDFQKITIVALAFLSVARAIPEYHRVQVSYGEDVTAYQDIKIDEEEQTVIVTVSKISSRKVMPSINFHDFTVGFSAIKDVEHGTCYIEKTRHTFDGLKEEVERAKQNDGYYEASQWFTCTSKKLVEKSRMSTYGERLAAFCADYESVFTVRTYTKRNKRSLELFSEMAFGCYECSGICIG